MLEQVLKNLYNGYLNDRNGLRKMINIAGKGENSGYYHFSLFQ